MRPICCLNYASLCWGMFCNLDVGKDIFCSIGPVNFLLYTIGFQLRTAITVAKSGKIAVSSQVYIKSGTPCEISFRLSCYRNDAAEGAVLNEKLGDNKSDSRQLFHIIHENKKKPQS